GARKALGLAGSYDIDVRAGRRAAPSFQTARTSISYEPISESETAFPARHGKPTARAAQRHPGAGHQARPGPPEHSRSTPEEGTEQEARRGEVLCCLGLLASDTVGKDLLECGVRAPLSFFFRRRAHLQKKESGALTPHSK